MSILDPLSARNLKSKVQIERGLFLASPSDFTFQSETLVVSLLDMRCFHVEYTLHPELKRLRKSVKISA